MARVANYDADGNLVWSDDPTLDTEPTARITVNPAGSYNYSSAPLGPVVNSEWPTVKLPVEGYGYQAEQPQQELKDYVASLPVAMPQQLITPSTARQVAKAGANLFGSVGDQPRFQTFPEVIARSALTAPADAAMGKFGITPEVPGQWSEMDQEQFNQAQEDAVIRAQDTASLAGGATFGMVKPSPLTVAAAESSRVGAPISALERAPIFYSAVEHAVQNAKQNVATTDQWLGYLKNQPGVKQEELDWVLGGLPEGKITKKELEEHIAANKVELKEVNKGETKIEQNPKEIYDNLYKSTNNGIEWQQLNQREMFNEQNKSPTKFSQWQLPGGENYKEMLLSLPENTKILDRTRDIGKRMEEIQNEFDSIDRTVPDSAALAERRKNLYNEKTALYKELTALHQQGIESQNFKSSHWSESNVLAHVRMNDRVIQDPQGNGGPLRTMHIEEIQSDWHQKGRKEGYKLSDAQLKEFNRIDKKIMDSKDEAILGNPETKDALKLAVEKKIITQNEANTWLNSYKGADNSSAVPNAPFKQSWPDLALKRIIRHAAENNYDAISWTPGEAQALRYQNEIRQKLNAVEWHNMKSGKIDPEGNKQILVTLASGSEIELTVSKDGTIVAGHAQLKNKKLDDVLGKDIASKVLEKDEGNIDAKGYVMNSKGMTQFYDKMLVDKANALANKFGGKVEQAETSDEGKGIGKITRTNVHILKLPQSLKDAALHKGFPLFADSSKVGAGLSALERVQLNPLDHNPFTLETYHGAPSPFQGSEIKDNRGFFHTTDPSLAGGKAIPTEGGYARSGRPLSQATGNNVMPLKTDIKDYHTYDAKGKTWQEVNQFAINEANQLNKKGIIVKNVVDSIDQNKTPRDVVITLDPSTVRSKFAKFDPKDFGKSGLMLADSSKAGAPLSALFKHSEADIKDAKEVLYGLMANQSRYKINNQNKFNQKLEDFKSNHELENIPLEKIDINHDWKRRIKDDRQLNTPVILVKKADDRYFVLDGQHRVLTKRDLNENNIKASVIKPDWHQGMKKGGMPTFSTYQNEKLLASGLPIITNKNGDLLDHETLQPLKDHLANPTNESNQPLPTHKTEKPAVHLDKRALALALAKMASYGAWAARPALGPALWAADIAALGASGAAPLKQRREGRPLANYKLVPVENPFK